MFKKGLSLKREMTNTGIERKDERRREYRHREKR